MTRPARSCSSRSPTAGILSDPLRARDPARQCARHRATIPAGAALIEFGSGSSRKARILLAAAPSIAAYVPVDISAEMLVQEAGGFPPRISAARGAAGRGRFHAPFALPARPPAWRISDSSPARPSAISSRTRPARSCAMPAACWGGRNLIIGIDLVKDTRSSTPPTTMPPASRRSSISICSRASTASSTAISIFEVLPSGVLQFRAPPHRNASRQPEAPEGESGRPDVRIPRRRNHPHREQLQVHARFLRGLARGSGWNPITVWTDAGKFLRPCSGSRTGDTSSAC